MVVDFNIFFPCSLYLLNVTHISENEVRARPIVPNLFLSTRWVKGSFLCCPGFVIKRLGIRLLCKALLVVFFGKILLLEKWLAWIFAPAG